MKQKQFTLPPRDRGPRANRKMLAQVSQHCFALGAYSTRTNPILAQQLNSIGNELDIYAFTANKRIDIYPSVFALYSCLSNLKSVIELGTDFADIMAKLAGEKNALIELLKIGVSSIDDSPFRNKHIQRFIANKRQIQAVYEMAMANRSTAKQSGARTAEVWEASSSILKGILDSLTELEGYATVSPSLSRKINRVANPHRMADFFNNPVRAQKESLKTHSQLCFIIKNVIEAFRGKQALDVVQAGYTNKLSYLVAPQVEVDASSSRASNRVAETEIGGDPISAVCVEQNQSTVGGNLC
ncbi:MAG: hypothetical protein K2M47_01460 [Clostridiales bacterium]|nr:hypothetical protein [Clostridiales bacterium]